jgi:hypothetical protein
MAHAQISPHAHSSGLGRGTFRSASTVLLKTTRARNWKKENKAPSFTKQEKVFMASLVLGAFGLGILTVTGVHLLLGG